MTASVLDQVLIKKPHRAESYENQQLREFALCADPVTGPLYFLTHFFYIQHPIKGKMLYAPYEYQVRLIATYHNYRFNVDRKSTRLNSSHT